MDTIYTITISLGQDSPSCLADPFFNIFSVVFFGILCSGRASVEFQGASSGKQWGLAICICMVNEVLFLMKFPIMATT
jgi:hypothetical protein